MRQEHLGRRLSDSVADALRCVLICRRNGGLARDLAPTRSDFYGLGLCDKAAVWPPHSAPITLLGHYLIQCRGIF